MIRDFHPGPEALEFVAASGPLREWRGTVVEMGDGFAFDALDLVFQESRLELRVDIDADELSITTSPEGDSSLPMVPHLDALGCVIGHPIDWIWTLTNHLSAPDGIQIQFRATDSDAGSCLQFIVEASRLWPFGVGGLAERP